MLPIIFGNLSMVMMVTTVILDDGKWWWQRWRWQWLQRWRRWWWQGDLEAMSPWPFPSLSSTLTPSMHGLLINIMVMMRMIIIIIIMVMMMISRWGYDDYDMRVEKHIIYNLQMMNMTKWNIVMNLIILITLMYIWR